jgi:DNA ligase-1
MLRHPESFYEYRRSKFLLKVKTFADSEAIVTGYEEGIGRCKDICGALKVRTMAGVCFSVGSGMTNVLR